MLQPLTVLADAASVGTASGLEPISLEMRRSTQVKPILFLVLSAAALWITGLAVSDRWRSQKLLGTAVLATFFAVIAVIRSMVAGKDRRWLRLDDEGLTVRGERIPWEAVFSAQWRSHVIRGLPGIVLRLRAADGYEPPRTGRVSIPTTLYGIAGIELLDLIVRYAQPHTVYVLPPRHGPWG